MLKITESNTTAIEKMLKEANGKATKHTYTTYAEIAAVAETAEKALFRLVQSRGACAGAKYVSKSGEKLPGAYKFKTTGTVVHLIRRSAGWYLVSAAAYTLWPRHQPADRLTLTAAQDTAAVAALRERYSIAAEAGSVQEETELFLASFGGGSGLP